MLALLAASIPLEPCVYAMMQRLPPTITSSAACHMAKPAGGLGSTTAFVMQALFFHRMGAGTFESHLKASSRWHSFQLFETAQQAR
mmetsp:Transcript_98620/g.306901  ORF Transcript_98620/g.306901 Transcript_98620/m.306901 type:complete len:86 (+) Transcript_98620:797-1054(+)